MNTNNTPTLAILTAVNAIITDVRTSHPSIPDVVVVLGTSAPTKHGHFAPKSWVTTTTDATMHEILLSGESLKRGGRATFGTIVHELAHAYCHANDIQDTSNRGRYHNKNFKTVAEEFGLNIAQAPTIGFSLTTVPDETAEQYAELIATLDEAISVYRKSATVEGTSKPKKVAEKYEMTCACGTIRVSKKFKDRRFECEDCGEHAIVTVS